METYKNEYPLLCTRGAIIFPLQELAIEVGRDESVRAVNYALSNSLNIVLVSQIDLNADSPKEDDLYQYGTLCRVKSSRNRGDHLKVIFAGLKRVKILNHYVNDNVTVSNNYAKYLRSRISNTEKADADILDTSVTIAIPLTLYTYLCWINHISSEGENIKYANIKTIKGVDNVKYELKK